MKRFLCVFLALILLSGCTGPAVPSETTTVPPETTVPVTQPPVPWIEESTDLWDREGVLREVSLDISGGIRFINALAFDGDLLLWSLDNHLTDVYTLELCLVELDTGAVTARRELDFVQYVHPQILEDAIYLVDGGSGSVTALNRELETKNCFTFPACEGSFYMGGKDTLYIYDWGSNAVRLNLNTGEEAPLLEDTAIDYFFGNGRYITVGYADPETGAGRKLILDLLTGEMLEPPIEARFDDLFYADGTWLCSSYRDGYTVYVGTEQDNFLTAELGLNNLELLDGDTLLLTGEDGMVLSLHDRRGKVISKAVLTEVPYSFSATELIESEVFGGYFVVITDHSGSLRLLYWDTSRGQDGADIAFGPIPEPDAQELAIRQRAEALSTAYGLNILVGSDCGTQFYDFTAEKVTDWETVSRALDTLEDALADYPEGFFRQLRYDTIRSVDIHLVGNIQATTEEYVHSYTAFVQYEYDRFTMGVDIFAAGQETYYHEFSHVIDSYLQWDADCREGALFSEDGWNEINPLWFPGYTFDYSEEVELIDNYSFIDSYSTIKPTEDRARIMEYAMAEYGFYSFEDNDILIEKLEYYCSCIRDAFDTTGWPETVLWEQYLAELTQ